MMTSCVGNSEMHYYNYIGSCKHIFEMICDTAVGKHQHALGQQGKQITYYWHLRETSLLSLHSIKCVIFTVFLQIYYYLF